LCAHPSPVSGRDGGGSRKGSGPGSRAPSKSTVRSVLVPSRGSGSATEARTSCSRARPGQTAPALPSDHAPAAPARGRRRGLPPESVESDYLVDPASSHMLVSKTKPCMSKYKPRQGETANGSLNQLWFLRSYYPTWIPVVILELIHARKLRPPRGRALLLDQNQPAFRGATPWAVQTLVTLDNFERIARPLRRRRIFQMSALSSFDGRRHAYRAYYG
jgi:hypothetical protein